MHNICFHKKLRKEAIILRFIILAAGEGSRLRDFTKTMPKCMVPFKGKPIIDYIISVAQSCNIKEMDIVLGYKGDVLIQHLKKYKDLKFNIYKNNYFSTTNMVYTLFCLQNIMNEDCIVSYSDIIYTKEVLDLMVKAKHSTVIVDRQWQQLWEKRMENPLSDAETLKYDKDGYIIELGKKPNTYEDIDGQYIGLFKLMKKDIVTAKEIYHKLDRNNNYDGKNFDNMYMTSFLQILINANIPLKAGFINGGWLEIDTIADLENLKDYSI